MEGISDILRVPLGYIMRLCYMLTQNYLFALLLFALVMQLVLLPLGIRQQKNMVRQAALRPKEMAIRKRYAGRTDKVTQQKMNEEVMKLYQEEKFNPMGGCLPLLIQMPILFALYQVITRPIRYLCGMSSATVEALKEKVMALTDNAEYFANSRMPEIDLANAIRNLGIENFTSVEGAEKLAENLIPKMTLFGGFDMSQIPTFASILILVPILNLVISFASSKLSKKFTYNPAQDAQAQSNASMKVMEWTMPLMSFFVAYQVPAAIGIYWIFRSILQFIQTVILSKTFPYPKFTEEDFKRAEKELKHTNKSYKKVASNIAVPHSLHHIDDDDDDVIRVEAPKAKQETKKSTHLLKDENNNKPKD
ncbi:MAG: membrane protein insertase YidC [Clostridia bacterium]|nr:membrane protein insertase YidC [Clostridia bacterium]